MNRIEINNNSCKGCGLCVRACPKNILQISKTVRNSKGYNPAECTDMEACIACKSCALTCPDVCITVYKD